KLTRCPRSNASIPSPTDKCVLPLWKAFHNGKTHLAVALAMEALMQSYNVYFITAHGMIQTLQQAHQNNTIQKKMKTFTKPHLLIIDEIGYRKMDEAAAHFFFLIISERYQICTSLKSCESKRT